ncbi:MAG TPA: DUF2911 domain-containing protein, partial [Longimicrobiales bacterium]|nr:DUF2911 domain-containing protein [Longimicrobiales bacterium]
MRTRALLAGVICLAVSNAAEAQKPAVSLHCVPQQTQNLATRPSPYDSLKITVGSQYAMLCYSRPSLKGRKMIGGEAIPYGKLWRT